MQGTQLTQYCITKDLIKKCFNINKSIPKGYGTRSSDYKHYYNQKSKLIIKAVEKIKEFQLPIKYGINEDVFYFSFEGQQFSFHGNYDITKQYNGKWVGSRRYSDAKTGNKTPGKNNIYID